MAHGMALARNPGGRFDCLPCNCPTWRAEVWIDMAEQKMLVLMGLL
jgi:hypothetical protein